MGFISHTWLIVSHSFNAKCHTLEVPCGIPNLAMCHPTPHALKNVKSRPPRNPTKFDMVAKFRETILTEKFVSSSEIYKHFGFSAKITILPFIQNHVFSGVSQNDQAKNLIDNVRELGYVGYQAIPHTPKLR